MSDEKERSENTEANGSRTGAPMPDCCGPMIERMMNAFREATEDLPRSGGADSNASCAAAMKRMASSCCGPGSTEETAEK